MAKIGIHHVRRVHLFVPNGPSINPNTCINILDVKMCCHSIFDIATLTLTGHWVFHQVKNGSWFVINIKAQCVTLVWQLNNEVWIAVNCHKQNNRSITLSLAFLVLCGK